MGPIENVNQKEIVHDCEIAVHHETKDGRKRYAFGFYLSVRETKERYALGSVYFDETSVKSKMEALVNVISLVTDYVKNADLIVFKGDIMEFRHKRRIIESRVHLTTAQKGVQVRCSYRKNLMFKVPDVMYLTNDALERGSTILCEL